MTIRTILVPLQNEEVARASLLTGLALARRFNAHVEALHIRPTPSIPASAYYPAPIALIDENFEALQAAIGARASRMKKGFDEIVAAEKAPAVASGFSATWRETAGSLPFDVARAARLHDLVCLNAPVEGPRLVDTDILEEAVFRSGRPVYLGRASEKPAFPRRVLIGWNGGREAARALAAALPFLALAEEVAVVCIGALPPNVDPLEAVVAYLGLHAVKASPIVALPAVGEAAEETFLAKATAWKADLVVMGAYSHSRWRELVLGGFTRHMVRKADIPLLLAH